MNKKLIKNIDLEEVTRQAKIELARREFFYYCNIVAPDFYKSNREYIVHLCNELQRFSESEDDALIINMPPRHGKSRTATLFVEWLLGRDNTLKIMTGSYNETLSTTFSKTVRNQIAEQKADKSKTVYSEIFPTTKIKRGDAAMNLWSLEGGNNNYLATSPSGTATGFGCDLMIIDDLIKLAEEAYNELSLDKQWKWFTNTMLSRLEEGGKIIIIMTRWATRDLAGRALDYLPTVGMKVRHINMKALQDDGSMLCDDVLSYQSYKIKTAAQAPEIAAANYQQEPIDIKGRMYNSLKTYTALPELVQIRNYTDTADTGADYLCSIVYGVTNDAEAYIIDLVYTKEPMEITEPLVARMLSDRNVNVARIESNNGGRGFARSVRRILQENRDNKTVIKWFSQTKNKNARIYSMSAWVQEHIYFPENWRDRWPEFYKAITTYQREGRNAHDDAPDALTGVAEYCGKSEGGISVLK